MSFNTYIASILLLVFSSQICFADNYELTSSIDLYTAFYDAIEADNFLEIQQFINFGVDINYRYDDGKTPLMLASMFGSARALRTLLKLGAEADLRSKNGKTALDYALANGDKFSIALLKSSSYANQELIKEIQFYLQKLGYNTGPIDGKLGPITTKALKRFAKRSKQLSPAEISHKQVEILKEHHFGIH